MTAIAGLRAGPPAHADAAGDAAAAGSTAARWEKLFGCPAPQRLPSLVEQAIAWREQVLAHGDLSPAIAHDLRLAVEHALQQRGMAVTAEQSSTMVDAIAGVELDDNSAALSKQSSASGSKLASTYIASAAAPPVPMVTTVSAPSATRRVRAAPLPPAASQLLPGSQLVKAYSGRNHVVTVEAAGFRYEGELFSSLSAVAKHITGTHWNGLLFFGLRKRRTYPSKPRRHD